MDAVNRNSGTRTGNWQSGAIVARSTRRGHAEAEQSIFTHNLEPRVRSGQAEDNDDIDEDDDDMDEDDDDTDFRFDMDLIVALKSQTQRSIPTTACGKDLLTVAVSTGLGNPPKNKRLNFRQEETLKTLPLDVRTVIEWIEIDPMLVTVVCCPRCFAMYPKLDTPKQNDFGPNRPDAMHQFIPCHSCES
ncbi:hypothetical protein PGT21_000355 [Puccinia graminis f. sp. tritici]|uniref:Uncharacterized protein n=1 Tax=Puccinia graminis f. sp. tritici TaxID=56615 RepID=A0A5B0LRS3_PUCGR|nr:hypothetical protein PGT21_000355 [Puccinia graminis f. sp. tritici]